MENINRKGSKIKTAVISSMSLVVIYLLISLYFTNHYFFNTVINGVNVSLKSRGKAEADIKDYVKAYELLIKERDGGTEIISGRDIGLQYDAENDLPKVCHLQNPLIWISLFFKNQKYYITDLYKYNKDGLNSRISRLNCLNKAVTEPKNVSFVFTDGTYDMVGEEYGNKIDKDRLLVAVKMFISAGRATLDLNRNLCYANPKYTFKSEKTAVTRDKLNRYVSARVTYRFGDKTEILDRSIINKWLSVDDDLEVVIDKAKVLEYLKALAGKYDTAGSVRSFKASTDKTVSVKGGTYGWKINQKAEAKALLENIYQGITVEKEPVYARKALLRDKDDIGNTYVEINITKQHLWFYKNGKLIADGPVVTGNPNKQNSTVTGTYLVIYKDKDATLAGLGYEVKVRYWMPFYGNMGIHDARWRYAFGGEIYKSKGTHGCVNAPYQLAKTIFENIEEGTPVVIYKEE